MPPTIRIVFLGDVVGEAGRRAVREFLASPARPHADLIVANAENSADEGFGVSEAAIKELRDSGIDVLTGGNHSFHHGDTEKFISSYDFVLRPANLAPEREGRGWCIVDVGEVRVAVVNLLGRLYMENIQSPFACLEQLLPILREKTQIILVDFHATSTGEKAGLAHYFDGKLAAVCGTHTHVQTADERILPCGTAYITDAGACAVSHSIIGMDFEAVLKKLVHNAPATMKAARGPAQVRGVIIETDLKTGLSLSIRRLSYEERVLNNSMPLGRSINP